MNKIPINSAPNEKNHARGWATATPKRHVIWCQRIFSIRLPLQRQRIDSILISCDVWRSRIRQLHICRDGIAAVSGRWKRADYWQNDLWLSNDWQNRKKELRRRFSRLSANKSITFAIGFVFSLVETLHRLAQTPPIVGVDGVRPKQNDITFNRQFSDA